MNYPAPIALAALTAIISSGRAADREKHRRQSFSSRQTISHHANRESSKDQDGPLSAAGGRYDLPRRHLFQRSGRDECQRRRWRTRPGRRSALGGGICRATAQCAAGIDEADRLGLEIGIVASSGWNVGGSWIPPEHAGKGLYHSATAVTGPKKVQLELPLPDVPKECPRDAGGRPVYLWGKWRFWPCHATPRKCSPALTVCLT
jgi:hypothetical protein